MVNNSININKMNNHLSYLLAEQKKNTSIYEVENPGPGLGQTYKYGGTKPVKRISTLPSR
jgi:hypothetical protein